MNVIQIQVKNPQNQMVTHEVTGTGKVEGSQEMAVFVQENLQVEQVLVHAGETVKKGDALMKLSGESISSAAKELENKIKTLEGQVKDLEARKVWITRKERLSSPGRRILMRLLRRAEMFLWIMQGQR